MSIIDNRMVSVIIPAYNVEQYVERCVYSVTKQTYRNLEIILVDDGSTDCTGIICDKLAKEDNRISVIHKTNGGLSDARNAGIDVSRGEYISFVDSDDYIASDMLEHMMNAMCETDISMVVVGFWKQSGDAREYCGPNTERVVSSEEALKDIYIGHEIYPASWNKLYRRALFNNNRFAVGMINEDSEIITKLLMECNRVALVSKPLYIYMIREGSITQSSFSSKDYNGIKAYRTAVNVCKKRKKSLLPYARYYETSRIYNTYRELVASDERMIKYRFLLRVNLFVRTIACLLSTGLWEQFRIEMMIYLLSSLIGYPATQRILSSRRKYLAD